MRKVPAKILSIKSIENYDIGYQKEKDRTANYNYPNNYVIGRLNARSNGYKHITYLENLSPIEEFNYVRQILEKYESDTTYIDVIIKDKDSIKANIYRKINQISDFKAEYMMWKWVESEYRSLNFKETKLMNLHLFNPKIPLTKNKIKGSCTTGKWDLYHTLIFSDEELVIDNHVDTIFRYFYEVENDKLNLTDYKNDRLVLDMYSYDDNQLIIKGLSEKSSSIEYTRMSK